MLPETNTAIAPQKPKPSDNVMGEVDRLNNRLASTLEQPYGATRPRGG